MKLGCLFKSAGSQDSNLLRMQGFWIWKILSDLRLRKCLVFHLPGHKSAQEAGRMNSYLKRTMLQAEIPIRNTGLHPHQCRSGVLLVALTE